MSDQIPSRFWRIFCNEGWDKVPSSCNKSTGIESNYWRKSRWETFAGCGSLIAPEYLFWAEKQGTRWQESFLEYPDPMSPMVCPKSLVYGSRMVRIWLFPVVQVLWLKPDTKQHQKTRGLRSTLSAILRVGSCQIQRRPSANAWHECRFMPPIVGVIFYDT